jgi:hypothetical protein
MTDKCCALFDSMAAVSFEKADGVVHATIEIVVVVAPNPCRILAEREDLREAALLVWTPQ